MTLESPESLNEYLEAAIAAIEAHDENIMPYLTIMCPECDEMPDEDDDLHVVVEHWVIVGCEGYHVINPNVIGLNRPDWNDWTENLEL